MTIYIFLYNVVAIKANLARLKKHVPNSRFILIASEYCLDRLSETNKKCFDATHSISRNFQEIDGQEVEKIVLDYLSLYGAKDIVLLTNEDSTQLVCGRLREKYGIAGYNTEQLLPFVDKVVSKNKLKGIINVPEFIKFNKDEYQSNQENYLQSIVANIKFPMFIKPINLVSSIGTHFVADMDTLRKTTNQISSQPYDYEIDRFIDGELFHCDVVSIKEEMHFFMAGKYAFPLAKFSKGSPMGSIPVTDKKLLQRLTIFTKKVLNHIGGFSSAFHLEVFVEKHSQELIFLEVAARTPGALVPEMYEITHQINLEELHYLTLMGLLNSSHEIKTFDYAGWITYPKIEGKLIEVRQPCIDVNNKIMTFVQPGDSLEQAHSLLDSSLSMIFWDESFPKLEKTFEFLREFKPLILEKNDNQLSSDSQYE